MKPFTKIVSVIIGIAGLIHLYRIVFPFRVMIGSFEVPGFASIAFVVFAIVFCVGLWREARRK